MRCALVNISTGMVENVIVADPVFDPAPEGYRLIGDLPAFVEIGSAWDGTKFIAPLGAIPPETADGLDML